MHIHFYFRYKCKESILHLSYQGTTLQDVFVGDVVLGIGFTIERDAFHILVVSRNAFGNHGKGLAICQVKNNLSFMFK